MSRKKRSGRASALVCLAFAGVLATGGTLAYLTTGTDKISNAFVPTEVACVVVENGESGFPPSGSLKEDVKVQNTGTTDAFIRAEIVVNWVKLDGSGNVVSVLGTAPAPSAYSLVLASGVGWSDEMDDGFYYYTGKVAPGDSTDELISSCAAAETAPVDGYVLRVDVVAEAIQAEGRTDGGKAPVDSWDNGSVEVTRADDGESIGVANKAQGA